MVIKVLQPPLETTKALSPMRTTALVVPGGRGEKKEASKGGRERGRVSRKKIRNDARQGTRAKKSFERERIELTERTEPYSRTSHPA